MVVYFVKNAAAHGAPEVLKYGAGCDVDRRGRTCTDDDREDTLGQGNEDNGAGSAPSSVSTALRPLQRRIRSWILQTSAMVAQSLENGDSIA